MRPCPPYPPGVYLKPGELHIAKRPSLIETVLGSCLAVAFYCPSMRCGALCHAMLPSGDGVDYKYVDASINHMVHVLRQHGMVESDVVAKLFGGSDMFDVARDSGPARFAVGAENIKMARAVLRRHRIDIKRTDVGGVYGRKLLFFSDTGQIFVKKLNRKAVDADLILLNAGVNKHG
ncbi:MAG: chemotaxis protein CheD [Desulfuromonas sp.]|nr:chemotaxis protein CheD [Desulfuromonas sp.]